MIFWLQFILCFAALLNGLVSFASYSYLPNSDLVSSVAFKSNSTTVLATFKTWDYGYRLRSIQNVAGNASISGHGYGNYHHTYVLGFNDCGSIANKFMKEAKDRINRFTDSHFSDGFPF